MEYTEILYLISKIENKDDIGNIVYLESQNKIYAKKNVVGTNEFYNAVAVGITPAVELQIKSLNYNDEEEAIYNNNKYSIIRTIPKGKYDLVLVLGHKQGIN